MRINADFSKRVVIRPEDYRWVPSPMPGVERMMLDRIGDEVARATSLVRYAPNSEFSRHVHGGGEEYLVLDGVFSDEYGDYPKGTYVRNPIGTSHAPKIGAEGCTIFVKLHQFDAADTTEVVIDTSSADYTPSVTEGLEFAELHRHGHEQVAVIRWQPNTEYSQHSRGQLEEILVLEGVFFDENGEYPAGTWLRSPPGSSHSPYTGDEGALIYIKVGHAPPGPE